MKNITVVNRKMISALINVFESWLEDKGITKKMVPNTERNGEYDNALIFGSDYDDLESEIRAVLLHHNIAAPEIFIEFDSDVIQNIINNGMNK